jgi:hypothetical protein
MERRSTPFLRRAGRVWWSASSSERRFFLGSLALAATITFVAISLATPAAPRLPLRSVETHVAAIDVRPALARASRPVYRHSVVPGGVYSFEEVIQRAESDPIVRVHYGPAIANAPVHLAAASRPRRVYMSYRIGDRIYWTRNRTPLNAGETTLTIGDIEIRARCGNRISDTEMAPVAADEPDGVEFDRLLADAPPPSVPSTLPPLIARRLDFGGSPDWTPPWGMVGPMPTITSDIPLGVGTLFPPDVPGLNPGPSPFGPLPPLVQPPDSPAVQVPLPVVTGPPVTTGPPDGERSDGPASTAPTPTPEPPGPSSPPARYLPPPEDDYLPPPEIDAPRVTPVPEPGTLVLLGSALAAAAAMRLRRRARRGD